MGQWSPFSGPSGEDPTGKLWTQIGRLSADEGGTEKNNFIQCWKYDTWYTGNGVDIVDVWEAKNRMWILCCDAAPEGREGGGRILNCSLVVVTCISRMQVEHALELTTLGPSILQHSSF